MQKRVKGRGEEKAIRQNYLRFKKGKEVDPRKSFSSAGKEEGGCRSKGVEKKRTLFD